MAIYPYTPIPASTSMATVLDPPYEYLSDAGYRVARTRYPRPLRRFQLEYLGLVTEEVRVVREFLIRHRLSVTPFAYNPYVVYDRALISNTTPVVLTMTDQYGGFPTHEFVTGHYVLLWGATVPSLDGQAYRITRLNVNQLALDGTIASGAGITDVRLYIPRATGTFDEGVLPAAVKLLGPESTYLNRAKWNMTVTISEQF
jgi:hypothetical protein